MADKMIRIAGRNKSGLSRPFKLDELDRVVIDTGDEVIENRLIKSVRKIRELRNTSGWTTQSDATLEIDRNVDSIRLKAPIGTRKFTRYFYSNPVISNGRYVKFRINIQDIEAIKGIGVLLATTSSISDFYLLRINKDDGLVQGEQTVEAHINMFTKTGDPQLNTQGLRALQFEVEPSAEKKASVSFYDFEIIEKKAYVVIGNDLPRKEFTEDVIPYFISRDMPFFIQLGHDSINDYMTNPEDEEARHVTLSKLKMLVDNYNCNLGFHFAAIDADADINAYREMVRMQMRDAAYLGLLKDGFHISARTNNWVSEQHREIAESYVTIVRRGVNVSHSTVNPDGGMRYHYISPATDLSDIPSDMLDSHNVNAVESVINKLVENQYGMYSYSHGTPRLVAEEYPYRTDWETFDALFRSIDKYKGKLEVISIKEMQEMYDYERLGIYTYR